MDPYIGEIRLFGFDFAPIGWMPCVGQILAIRQYTALFSILGTNFGGNGTSNFGLPNLQGAVPLGQGIGPGLSPFAVGESGGEPLHTLLMGEMPIHAHPMMAKPSEAANTTPVAGSFIAQGHGGSRGSGYEVRTYTTSLRTTTLNSVVIGPAGENFPHNNMQPSLVMNWCIAITGVFPTRS